MSATPAKSRSELFYEVLDAYGTARADLRGLYAARWNLGEACVGLSRARLAFLVRSLDADIEATVGRMRRHQRELAVMADIGEQP